MMTVRDRPQHLAAALGGQQQVQRLGGRHENVRRRPKHRRALGLRRVAGADGGGHARRLQAELFRHAAQAAARFGQVLVDVRAQRLQRRHVDDAHLIRKRRPQAFLEEVVERRQKRRERLARAGRRRDERVAAFADRCPAAELCSRRRVERFRKPPCGDWMEIQRTWRRSRISGVARSRGYLESSSPVSVLRRVTPSPSHLLADEMDAANPSVEPARRTHPVVVAGQQALPVVVQREAVAAETSQCRIRASRQRLEAKEHGRVAPRAGFERLRLQVERLPLTRSERGRDQKLLLGARQSVLERRVLLQESLQRRPEKRQRRISDYERSRRASAGSAARTARHAARPSSKCRAVIGTRAGSRRASCSPLSSPRP